jgi:hypothetical protein
VVASCEAVMSALAGQAANNGNGAGRKLVVDYGTYGHPLKRSFGVSVYFPCVGEIPSCYPALEFCRLTQWHKFLGAFLSSPTGRPAIAELPKPSIGVVEEKWNKEPLEDPAVQPEVVPAVHSAVHSKDPDLALNGSLSNKLEGALFKAMLDVGHIKTTYDDPIKTTYGDVIKTTYGDPIKKPDLPAWILPRRPAVTPGASLYPVRRGPTDSAAESDSN